MNSPCQNPNNSPFKTSKIVNKTVRTILQIIGYVIAAILGAAGEATLMVTHQGRFSLSSFYLMLPSSSWAEVSCILM
jgi:hypothetical protein